MTLKTVGGNPRIGVASITKFFTAEMAGGTIFQAVGFNPHPFPHCQLTARLQKIHVVAAHPLGGFYTLFALWPFQLQRVGTAIGGESLSGQRAAGEGPDQSGNRWQ